jgi:DNA-binding HxlR family transcriptional regulator
MPKQASAMTKRGVRGSRTGRPVMALLDLLGRRWTLRIVWELREHRALTSRALRAACDEASPTVLNERLKELREAGFVDLGETGGYALTPLGRELSAQVMPLYRFAEKWSGRSRS